MQEYQEINTSFVTISGYGVSTMTLNPSAIDASSGSVMSIEYVWSNGKITTVSRKLDVSGIDSSSFAFPADPGDPRNIVVSQVFYPGVNVFTHYTIQVQVKYSNQASKQLVSVIDFLLFQAPLLDDGLNGGFAQSVHLVANRSWNPTDKKLFVLETVNPGNVFILTPN